MYSSIFLVILMTSLLTLVLSASNHSPYQVSIRLKPQMGNNDGVHLCNGAIVHEDYILTTGECMHFQVAGAMATHPIFPAMISVLAGNISDPKNPKVVRSVLSIELLPNYNASNLENDIAILKLNESLPLKNRTDLEWLVMDDDDQYDHRCVASFFNPWSNVQLFLPPQSVMVMDTWFCGNLTEGMEKDICSSYVVSAGTMCNISAVELKTSADRGTPLVCEGRLVGLLSTILPPNENTTMSNCTVNRKLNAYYTRISKHLTWIYGKIRSATPSPTNKTTPAPASPLHPLSSTATPVSSGAALSPPSSSGPQQQSPPSSSSPSSNSTQPVHTHPKSHKNGAPSSIIFSVFALFMGLIATVITTS